MTKYGDAGAMQVIGDMPSYMKMEFILPDLLPKHKDLEFEVQRRCPISTTQRWRNMERASSDYLVSPIAQSHIEEYAEVTSKRCPLLGWKDIIVRIHSLAQKHHLLRR